MIFMHIDEEAQTFDGIDNGVQPVSRRLLDCVDEEATAAFLRRRLTGQSSAQPTASQQASAEPALKMSR